MAWILLEGLDRSGKSSVAEYYREQGYEIVHMEAPDKKYSQEGYAGESYLEEVVRMYSRYEGKDVVFDRTIYGELVWPNVYGRVSLLEDEDIEYLANFERNNEAEKILMFDSNTEAHWQRCVENKEPLTRQQFGRASVFYDRLFNEYGFIKKELRDFPDLMPDGAGRDDGGAESDSSRSVDGISSNDGNSIDNGSGKGSASMGSEQQLRDDDKQLSVSLGASSKNTETVEEKLERANAIRVLLQGTIVKKKGKVYNDLDEAIRGFLQQELDSIFKPPREKNNDRQGFSDEEITILRALTNTIKKKQEQ